MKSLQAHFDNILEAQKAILLLRENGCKSAHLDASGFFTDEHSMELGFVHDRKNQSLSSLILKKNNYMYNIGKGPLTAANPEVSGMSSSDGNEMSAVVLVNVEDDQADTVRALIREHGGRT